MSITFEIANEMKGLPSLILKILYSMNISLSNENEQIVEYQMKCILNNTLIESKELISLNRT